MTETQLKRLQYAISTYVSSELADDLSFSPEVTVETDKFIADMLLVGLRGFIWGRTLEDVKIPADWWQAFKDRWFPGWLKSKFPVRHMQVLELYPKTPLQSECVLHIKD